jgi:putative CocE/NonD family hydrolase
VYRAGWYDAGTALGAMVIFASLSNPRRIIVGPWNHTGYFRADPFQAGDGTTPQAIPMEEVHTLTTASLDAFFKDDVAPLEMDVLVYHTLGENKWKSTHVWPLPETRMERMFLSANSTLGVDAPSDAKGSDRYQVDPTTGTGQYNRWHTQMGQPVHHPDRRETDQKLLVYDTPPLETNLEITGHPVVHLFVRSNATDGQFYVYLEAVLPDGRVKCVTDGQLRAIHRKISEDPPPYTMFGPYHTFERNDALPLVPGEVAEIAFDLFPISVRFEAGWRIRLAIAGADKDVFAPIPGCEAPEITVERNSQHASYIDLPIIPR